jgi:tyrosinase
LTPFHKTTTGAFWTSNDVRDITKLGYTYPELVGNPPNATLVASIKAQYSDAPATMSKSKRQAGAPKNTTLYLAEITLPLYGLDNGAGGASPYSVLVFVGDVGNDASKWTNSEAFVGLASTIGGTMMKNDQVAVSTVDLTYPLSKAIASGATTEEKAVEYLKENLHYRIELVSRSFPLLE